MAFLCCDAPGAPLLVTFVLVLFGLWAVVIFALKYNSMLPPTQQETRFEMPEEEDNKIKIRPVNRYKNRIKQTTSIPRTLANRIRTNGNFKTNSTNKSDDSYEHRLAAPTLPDKTTASSRNKLHSSKSHNQQKYGSGRTSDYSIQNDEGSTMERLRFKPLLFLPNNLDKRTITPRVLENPTSADAKFYGTYLTAHSEPLRSSYAVAQSAGMGVFRSNRNLIAGGDISTPREYNRSNAAVEQSQGNRSRRDNNKNTQSNGMKTRNVKDSAIHHLQNGSSNPEQFKQCDVHVHSFPKSIKQSKWPWAAQSERSHNSKSSSVTNVSSTSAAQLLMHPPTPKTTNGRIKDSRRRSGSHRLLHEFLDRYLRMSRGWESKEYKTTSDCIAARESNRKYKCNHNTPVLSHPRYIQTLSISKGLNMKKQIVVSAGYPNNRTVFGSPSVNAQRDPSGGDDSNEVVHSSKSQTSAVKANVHCTRSDDNNNRGIMERVNHVPDVEGCTAYSTTPPLDTARQKPKSHCVKSECDCKFTPNSVKSPPTTKVFCGDQLTAAVNGGVNLELLTKENAKCGLRVEVKQCIRRCTIYFLDLDNTLIPTSWIMCQWKRTCFPLFEDVNKIISHIRMNLRLWQLTERLDKLFTALYAEGEATRITIVTNAATRTVDSFYLACCLPELPAVLKKHKVKLCSTEKWVKLSGPIPPPSEENLFKQFYTNVKYLQFEEDLHRVLTKNLCIGQELSKPLSSPLDYTNHTKGRGELWTSTNSNQVADQRLIDIISVGDQLCEIAAACRLGRTYPHYINMVKVLMILDPLENRFTGQTPQAFIKQLLQLEERIMKVAQEPGPTLARYLRFSVDTAGPTDVVKSSVATGESSNLGQRYTVNSFAPPVYNSSTDCYTDNPTAINIKDSPKMSTAEEYSLPPRDVAVWVRRGRQFIYSCGRGNQFFEDVPMLNSRSSSPSQSSQNGTSVVV